MQSSESSKAPALRGKGLSSSVQLWWAWLVSSWLLYGAVLNGEAGQWCLVKEILKWIGKSWKTTSTA